MPVSLIPLALAAGAVLLHRHHRRPRKVFFSFHYADIWRVNQVKKCWVTQPNARAAGFFDRSLEEVAKTEGDEAVRALIDEALEDTEVTVVLIGARTASRRWVRYEIEQSALRGNGLLGITIHNLRGSNGRCGSVGKSPFSNFYVDEDQLYTMDEFVPEYDWRDDEGRDNIGAWLRDAPNLKEILREVP